jgi:potassium uptake TrkH family protein
MNSLLDKFNSSVFSISDNVLSFVKIVSFINVSFAIVLLVYRFGFLPDDEQISIIFRRMDILFAVFCIVYFLRVLFAFHRRSYMGDTLVELILILFIILHGFLNYAFDYKLVLRFVSLLPIRHPDLVNQHILSLYLLILVGLEITKVSSKISEINLRPASTFIFSFILLIGVGTFLLMLPAMSHAVNEQSLQRGMSFLDALFTSVSASCVTGLAVQDTGTYFTFKGQIVLLLLMQIGGLGVVSFTTFFVSFMSKGVGLKHQSIIQDFLSSETLTSAKQLLRKLVLITVTIETLGAIAIYFSFPSDLVFKNGVADKVFYAIFHSVSAFCNAGFALFRDSLYTNDVFYTNPNTGEEIYVNVRSMYQLHFFIALLIILGGIGFSTLEDIYNSTKKRLKKPWLKWSITTRISLRSSAFLIVIGTIGFFLLEFDQLRDRNIIEAIDTAFFQSVTTRTAGFNSMDFSKLRTPTIIMCIFFMIIGASPGSTGGGIKTTTFYLISRAVIDSIRGQKFILVERRTIPNELIFKSFAVLLFAATYNFFAIFLLSITEANNPEIEILAIVFEQISAFATVGLSMGITTKLSVLGKIIIIVSMFIGRIGTLTLALALSTKVTSNKYSYPEGYIMVG